MSTRTSNGKRRPMPDPTPMVITDLIRQFRAYTGFPRTRAVRFTVIGVIGLIAVFMLIKA